MLPGTFDKQLEKIISQLPEVLAGLGTFLVFWLISVGVQKIFKRIEIMREKKPAYADILLGTVRSSILILGAITALGTMGVNVLALVASLGLAGFAFGFALKDALSNLLAGLLVLFYRPFQIGDNIKVAGFEGKVFEVNLRYTVLISDTNRILIPNSMLFTNSLVVADRKGDS